MPQIVTAWTVLSLRRRIIVGLATAAIIAAVMALARLSTQGDMALLYSGLDPTASGEVIKALDAQGAGYQVRGTAIYVDAAQRDLLRMNLAAGGLPASNGDGYELLDSMSGFGTTAQMFDAAYWRAKEGELARTILANPDVRAARVHISAVSGRTFDRDFRPSASVAVTTSGAAVTPDLAKALRFLVASAVAGLVPDKVAVIDSRSGRVLGADTPGTTDPTGRAEELRMHVQRLLEARVGPGRAMVEVSVDVVKDSESILERQIDPNSRVQISTETEEKKTSAQDGGQANVTVASNLPTGAGAGAGGQQTQSSGAETRERVNYDVSETKREVTRAAGGIARITVAVLVDGQLAKDAQGNDVWTPRPDEELAALHDLVASAVGYDESRHDTITIKSMQFQPVTDSGTLADQSTAAPWIDVQALAEVGALALVALILGLFVLRPALTARPALPAPGPPLPDAPAPEPGRATALTGTIDGGPGFDAIRLTGGDTSFPAMATVPEDPVTRLRALIADRREETIEILRGWMEEREGAE